MAEKPILILPTYFVDQNVPSRNVAQVRNPTCAYSATSAPDTPPRYVCGDVQINSNAQTTNDPAASLQEMWERAKLADAVPMHIGPMTTAVANWA